MTGGSRSPIGGARALLSADLPRPQRPPQRVKGTFTPTYGVKVPFMRRSAGAQAVQDRVDQPIGETLGTAFDKTEVRPDLEAYISEPVTAMTIVSTSRSSRSSPRATPRTEHSPHVFAPGLDHGLR